MTGVMGEILEHYGQTVTLRSRDGEKSVRAFIQPAAARDETVPGEQTSIGWIDERLWRYTGLEEVQPGDNESRPVTYEQVTLRELIRCHAEPYGISCGAAADLRPTVPYTAGAGISQWKVISEFCRTYGGFLPRFAKTGELLATPEQDSGKRIILDSGSPVLNCRIREDHYGVLTEALVIDKRQNVSYSVKNPEMIAKGGQCRRVIYTPGRSTWDAMRYTGEYQIQQSKKEEQAVTVTLPGSFGAFPGDRVTVRLEKLGLTGNYRVAETENRFSAREGAVMIWTLKECG